MNKEQVKEILIELLKDETILNDIVLKIVEKRIGDLTAISEFNNDNIFNK